MMKLGAGLSAILAGVLLGLAPTGAADQPSRGVPDAGISPEAITAAKNFSVGFIRPATPYEAKVSQITGDNQTTGNKRLLGAGDQIYLELTNPEEIAPGDKFTIYRQVKKVYHPTRGQYLGDLTAVLGIVKVLRVTGNKATVKVERSYDAIYPGDGATRQLSPAPAPASSNQSLPEGTGMIVELPPGQTLIGQGSVVYIDWGRNDGVKVGDQLEVFRENPGIPLQIIGVLHIVAVEDQTATARVIRSLAPFLLGDRFAARATLQKQLGLDVPSSLQARKEALFQEMTPVPAAAAPQTGSLAMSQEAHAAPQSRDIERELAQLAKRLEFDSGTAPATAASLPILKKMKALLQEAPGSRLVVEGHTDNQKIGPSLKGQYNSNQELSRARAAAVASFLSEEGGLAPENVSVAGYADTKPVASNSTEEGRKHNRRIEIRLLPGERLSSPAKPAKKDAVPETRELSPPAPEAAPTAPAPSAP